MRRVLEKRVYFLLTTKIPTIAKRRVASGKKKRGFGRKERVGRKGDAGGPPPRV